MLRHMTPCFGKYRFGIEKKLFVYDDMTHNTNGNSGIKATVFGPSGLMGKPICAKLGSIGSDLIMPVALDHHYTHSEHLKELKLCGAVNKSWVEWDAQLKDQTFIERMVQNSNVVINLCGPRKKVKHLRDFEFINIDVAERIAKACRKHGVHRLIHFSAAGADRDSESLDFRTKAVAEDAVRAEFPNATIFRPCPIYGQNDYFASNIQRQLYFFWNHFVLVYDDCMAKKQPIKDSDVARCVLNALKLEETKGKTYELGGPNVLSMLEVHEIIFNMMKLRPSIAYVNRDLALKASEYLYNFEFFGKDYITKKSIDEVVKAEQYGTVKDLMVEPVTFKNGIFEIVRQFVAKHYEEADDNDN